MLSRENTNLFQEEEDEVPCRCRCKLCKNDFILENIFVCMSGRYMCTACYNYLTNPGKIKRTPFPPMEEFCCEEEIRSKSLNGNKVVIPIVPERCPYFGCNILVALSSVAYHFDRDHANVEMHFFQQFGSSYEYDFDFNIFENGSNPTQVIGVLCFPDPCASASDSSFGDISSASASASTIDVSSAAASTCSTTRISFPKSSSLENITDITCIITAHQVWKNEGCNPKDHRYIFYIISNYKTKYSYTLTVSSAKISDGSGQVPYRVKFVGKLMSMEEGFRKMFRSSNGLIMNGFEVAKLTNMGKSKVLLQFVIHDIEEEDDEDENRGDGDEDGKRGGGDGDGSRSADGCGDKHENFN